MSYSEPAREVIIARLRLTLLPRNAVKPRSWEGSDFFFFTEEAVSQTPSSTQPDYFTIHFRGNGQQSM